MCSLITSSTQVFSILLVRYVLTDIRENGQSKTIIECAINSIPDCFLIHALQTLSFVIFASHLISRMKDQSVTEVLKKPISSPRQYAESYQGRRFCWMNTKTYQECNNCAFSTIRQFPLVAFPVYRSVLTVKILIISLCTCI